jgi:hypothetical protein
LLGDRFLAFLAGAPDAAELLFETKGSARQQRPPSGWSLIGSVAAQYQVGVKRDQAEIAV